MDKNTFGGLFIKEEYFKENSHFEKMLDHGDTVKQSKRKYIFLKVKYGENNLYIPLRTNLGNPIRRFGVIGFKVPSETKPLAGLDYRYILIVNENKYIEVPEGPKIPKSQMDIIDSNYRKIEKEVISYVNGYVKAAIKHRERLEPKYRESALHNFHKELGVIEGRKKREEKLKIKNENK